MCRYDYSGYGASTGKVHHSSFVMMKFEWLCRKFILSLLVWNVLISIFFKKIFQPSEFDTYADIEAAYECLQTEYGVSQEDVILYGQSVGSGPTLHLAAQLPRLRGVVLHSGILSGLRVLCHVKFSFCFDIYKVSSPTSIPNESMGMRLACVIVLFTKFFKLYLSQSC